MVDLRKQRILSCPPEGLFLAWLWYRFCVWKWEAKLGYAKEALDEFYQSRQHRDLDFEDLTGMRNHFEFRVAEAESVLARYRRSKNALEFVLKQRGVGTWVGV